MKKKLLCLFALTFSVMIAVMACGQSEESATVDSDVVEIEAVEEIDDQAAADNVAALIDAIYVQTRTDETDAQCEAAKAAWDALTDTQKELVEGEYADYDYFGLDTGDASKDDPLNQDDIGEDEILVVSFGTSYNDSRVEDIGGIEKAISAAYPEYSVRRAFTSQIIINHIQARDGEKIDNVEQALERAVANGVKNLVVQPTHLMHGAEYDELIETVEEYADNFESVEISEPLLGEVGAEETDTNDDKKTVAKAIVTETVKDADLGSVEAATDGNIAFVFMGHGTSHTAKITYTQMQTQMDELGYDNVFIGTVEGEPEETSVENVIDAVKEAGYTKVILRPLMVVAGDHANNDMAGDDEDSWLSMFLADGSFESVECQIAGLGEISDVQQIYVSHLSDATGVTPVATAHTDELKDGEEYLADFNTDSSMFRVNEAMDGKGVLTVKNGKMSIHISLVSEKIVNLYVGKAAEAESDEANWLNPTEDEVTYSDGTTETVYGFDVPVEKLNEDFDLAILGEKGTWYDHKVSVTNPQLSLGDE